MLILNILKHISSPIIFKYCAVGNVLLFAFLTIWLTPVNDSRKHHKFPNKNIFFSVLAVGFIGCYNFVNIVKCAHRKWAKPLWLIHKLSFKRKKTKRKKNNKLYIYFEIWFGRLESISIDTSLLSANSAHDIFSKLIKSNLCFMRHLSLKLPVWKMCPVFHVNENWSASSRDRGRRGNIDEY